MDNKYSILIVADNNFEKLIKILEESSYQITLRQNVEQALEFIQKREIDLILLNTILASMATFKFCQRLKENNNTKNIPIIFISSSKEAKEEVKAFKVGGIDYISQPFYKENILARIKRHIKSNNTKKILADKVEKQKILLDNIDTQIWSLKDEKTYGIANESHAKFLGVSKERLENKLIFQIQDKQKTELCIEENKKVFSTKQKLVVRKSEKNADGELKLLLITKIPKLDQEANVEYVICSAQDISEKENIKYDLYQSNYKLKERIKELEGLYFISKLVQDRNNSITDILNKLSNKIASFWQYPELACARIIYGEQEFFSKNFQETIWKQSSKIIVSETEIGAIEVYYLEKKPEIDEGPFLNEERDLIDSISNILGQGIERRITESELKNLYESLEKEFEKGSKLHQQFLPSDMPQIEGLSYDTFFQPSAKLGGDFYDIIKLKNQVLFYLSDVSGHGLDSSMLNIFLRETINNYLIYQHHDQQSLSPSDLINFIANRYIKESFPSDYFICVLMAVLDLDTMRITFINAGFQVPPIIVKGEGELSFLFCRGMPISSIDVFAYTEEELYIDEGDLLFLTTDGLIEETLESGDDNIQYGENRLKEVLINNHHLATDLITSKIMEDFEKFSGSKNGQDDITFLSIKKEASSNRAN